MKSLHHFSAQFTGGGGGGDTGSGGHHNHQQVFFPMARAAFIDSDGDENGRGFLRAFEGFEGLRDGLEGLRGRKGMLVDCLFQYRAGSKM